MADETVTLLVEAVSAEVETTARGLRVTLIVKSMVVVPDDEAKRLLLRLHALMVAEARDRRRGGS